MDWYSFLRPALFTFEPERAHKLVLEALKRKRTDHKNASAALVLPRLAHHFFGLPFANPLGLAAGFDKNAEVIPAMRALGFGFVEVGTLTPKAQTGNPTPRLFRLVEDQAIINRLGFNNNGHAAALARLELLRTDGLVIGVNIGANKDSADRLKDYALGVATFKNLASYLTVNISSPNTPDLRALQQRDLLSRLIEACLTARAGQPIPLFVKIAPDLEVAELEDIAEVCLAFGVEGLIVSNTTLARPHSLRSRHSHEAGGLSGKPLFDPSTALLRRLYPLVGQKIKLIGVGGVSDGESAYAKIRAGASLVQLYSALIYQGPALVARLLTRLDSLLERDGFSHYTQAIGIDA
jgi:dihydroorotate dehydrogenase